MYYCFNIIAGNENEPSAVLIRSAEPIQNLQKISMLRYNKNYETLTKYQKNNLLNGPGKLCKGLLIDKSFNEKTVLSDEIYILNNEKFDSNIIKCGKRINIDYSQEAKDFLWRFYI